jgi:hypothetical protein
MLSALSNGVAALACFPQNRGTRLETDMKDGKMKEHDERPRKVSTCFEGWPGAEMMQKILGQGGIGSLCEEVLRSVGKKLGGGPQGPREDKRPARDEGTDPEPQAAPSRNKAQNSGGVK